MRIDLMRAVLECGSADLDLLDGAGADMYDLVGQLRNDGLEVTMENLLLTIFTNGIAAMAIEVNRERDRLEVESAKDSLADGEREKLETIRKFDLDPDRDFHYYINSLDTHLYCYRVKREVYEKYFADELDDLFDYTGFEIEEWEG